jgi:macrolide transport system ATP-binding/permease protein
VLAGLISGLAASLAAGSVIEKFLFETRALDATVILAVVILFGGAALVAAFIPARRAASIDPMDALRPE